MFDFSMAVLFIFFLIHNYNSWKCSKLILNVWRVLTCYLWLDVMLLRYPAHIAIKVYFIYVTEYCAQMPLITQGKNTKRLRETWLLE